MKAESTLTTVSSSVLSIFGGPMAWRTKKGRLVVLSLLMMITIYFLFKCWIISIHFVYLYVSPVLINLSFVYLFVQFYN